MEVGAEVEEEIFFYDGAFAPRVARGRREKILRVIFVSNVLEPRGQNGRHKDWYQNKVARVMGDHSTQPEKRPVEEVVEFLQKAAHDGAESGPALKALCTQAAAAPVLGRRGFSLVPVVSSRVATETVARLLLDDCVGHDLPSVSACPIPHGARRCDRTVLRGRPVHLGGSAVLHDVCLLSYSADLTRS